MCEWLTQIRHQYFSVHQVTVAAEGEDDTLSGINMENVTVGQVVHVKLNGTASRTDVTPEGLCCIAIHNWMKEEYTQLCCVLSLGWAATWQVYSRIGTGVASGRLVDATVFSGLDFTVAFNFTVTQDCIGPGE